MTSQTTSPQILGFDIGGTNTKLGLVDINGHVSHSLNFPTNAQGDSSETFLMKLFSHIHRILGETTEDVVGIGASVHGWTNDDRTEAIYCFNTPALFGLNIKKTLEDEFGLPTVINNDLTAHALAEYTFGSGQGCHRFLCLALGTGLGAGVIVDGQPLRYVGGCAGDNGHIILEPGGPSCTAGCKGCGEALIGVAGIERLGRIQYSQERTAYEIIAAAREGNNPIATGIMKKIGTYTGQLLASLAATYLPDRIALTGGTVEAGPVLLDAVKERFEELVGDYHRNYDEMGGDYYNGVEIVIGRMRGETGIVGAATELLLPYISH